MLRAIRCGPAGLLREPPGQDAGWQAVGTHRGAVPPPPVGRAGRMATVEVDDVTMTERGEVLDGQPDARLVDGAHYLDGRGADPPGHHQDGELAGELGEPGGGRLGPDVPGRCEPGTGEINYPAIAAALADLGYAGTVGLEAWAADGDSERALARFRAAFTPAAPS